MESKTKKQRPRKPAQAIKVAGNTKTRPPAEKSPEMAKNASDGK